MLMMVMANPIQFTMVNELPLIALGAFCATRVENKGESAITENPQININKRNTETD